MLRNLFIFLISVTCSPTQAGEITSDPESGVIEIRGEINKGDYQKIMDLIRKENYRLGAPGSIAIISPGGDVIEAMKIGRLARRGLLEVMTVGQCNSSCFIILVSGVSRMIGYPEKTSIGLHRPKYDDSYFSGLAAEEAKAEYDRLDQLVREYLSEVDVPTRLIDKMMSTSSGRIHFVNGNDLLNEIGTEAPFYNEWLISKCGTLSSDEAEDHSLVFKMKLYEIGLSKKDSEYDFTKKKADGMSSGYKQYLIKRYKEIEGCNFNARSEERRRIFNEILNSSQ